MDLDPQSWSARGSLDTDLDRILATAAEGSLPDSLPGGAGSLENASSFNAGSLGLGGAGSLGGASAGSFGGIGSLERVDSLERVSSFGSMGMSAGFRMSQSSLPSPGFGARVSSSSLPSPGGSELFNLFPVQPTDPDPPTSVHIGLSPAELPQGQPLQRQKSVPAKAEIPELVKVANTSCTLRWNALPDSEDTGLWYHLYRIDEGAVEGGETSTLVYSTQDTGFLKFTCAGLVEGTEYHFGLVVESCDRMTQSALSDLLAVRVGLSCTFAHLHSNRAGATGKNNVQEKPFSRVNWVKMKQPPPPICERCTSTLRKHFQNQTTSPPLCLEFCVHVEKVRCKKCQEWCTSDQCLTTGDFLCANHSNAASAQPVVPAETAAAAAAPKPAAPPAQWAQPQAADDLGGLGGMMARTSIQEDESPTHGPTLATETDEQMSQRLVRHKVEQLVQRLKEENFGQLLSAQYSDRTEQDHLEADGFVSQPQKRSMVGKSFENVVTTQLGELMIVVFDHMRERVAQLPSYVLPKWHAAYGTSTFEQLWELEHARSELVQEVLSREDFGRNLFHAVKRAADTGELPESHADMLNRPGFYDCWNGVLAQSGCVMVVYTCPHNSAAAAARAIAALPTAFHAAGVSAVAPIISGQLGEIVYTGLAARDHDCVFGGEVVPLEGAMGVLERMVEAGYEAEACEWIAAKPSVAAWQNVESMSLLHKAVLCGAVKVATALLAVDDTPANGRGGGSQVPPAQRTDAHGKSSLDYAALMDEDELYALLQNSLPAPTFTAETGRNAGTDVTLAPAAVAAAAVPAGKPGRESLAVSELSDPAGSFSPYQDLLRGRADSILSEIASGARSSVGRGSLSTSTAALPAVVQTATAAAALTAGAKVIRANIVECKTVTPGGEEGKQHPYVEYRVVVEAQRSGADTTVYQWEIHPRFSEFKALHASLEKCVACVYHAHTVPCHTVPYRAVPYRSSMIG